MNLKYFFRSLQGERRGMGSELIMPDKLGEKYAAVSLSPSIVVQQGVLLADVSFWQGSIDFVKMKAEGIKGVIIRAGQRNWPDVRFKENWAKAKAAGLPRGSYWFYDSREDPEKQAALWWSLICDDPGELVHAADFEESYGGQYFKPEHFETFLNEFRWLSKLPADRVPIYTAYYYWLARVGVAMEFKQYPLWLAWYADMSVVRIPGPWSPEELLFWQWTSSGNGTKYGVGSLEIDLSWYCCSEAEFNQRFHLTPTQGGTMPKYEAVALGDNTRLRADHSTDNLPVGNYPRGTKFHGDNTWTCTENRYNGNGLLIQKAGDQWLQVTDVNGSAMTGWVAIQHLGYPICTIYPPISTTPTTPTDPPATTLPDLPYTITLGDDVTYTRATITGVLKPK